MEVLEALRGQQSELIMAVEVSTLAPTPLPPFLRRYPERTNGISIFK
jgi:hypothetical protein